LRAYDHKSYKSKQKQNLSETGDQITRIMHSI
jgi:hypothetical protein